MNRNSEQCWDKVIRPRRGLLDIHPGDLWKYRDLIALLVRRDFVAIYKQTVLGPLWFILQPLVSTVVFTVVFGRIAKISTGDMPHTLFYMSGIVAWNYFSSCLTRTSDTFVANASIFGKVYFPRLAVPIAAVIVNLIVFVIQFCLFLLILAYFHFNGAHVNPNAVMWAIPLLVLEMAALGLGVGILVSSLTIKYRDMAYLMSFVVQLWMYATPIVYPIASVPQNWKWIYALNPMTAVVETFRHAFLGTGLPDVRLTLTGLLITCLMLVSGVVLFGRVENNFMDSV